MRIPIGTHWEYVEHIHRTHCRCWWRKWKQNRGRENKRGREELLEELPDQVAPQQSRWWVMAEEDKNAPNRIFCVMLHWKRNVQLIQPGRNDCYSARWVIAIPECAKQQQRPSVCKAVHINTCLSKCTRQTDPKTATAVDWTYSHGFQTPSSHYFWLEIAISWLARWLPFLTLLWPAGVKLWPHILFEPPKNIAEEIYRQSTTAIKVLRSLFWDTLCFYWISREIWMNQVAVMSLIASVNPFTSWLISRSALSFVYGLF